MGEFAGQRDAIRQPGAGEFGAGEFGEFPATAQVVEDRELYTGAHPASTPRLAEVWIEALDAYRHGVVR